MFGPTRWSPFEDIFNFQREADRLFNQFWNELPRRSVRSVAQPFQVYTTEDSWRLEIPLPGIDPKDVHIEVAGSSISVRAEQNGGHRDGESRYEQTMTVPQFLDLERITAAHRHGMLELTLPLKDSVKPRRVQIEGVTESPKQLTTA
jgi:HSP20 family molecular chaperone IbpA